MKLLKTQRNQVFEILVANGWHPSEFSWNLPQYGHSRLIHNQSKWYISLEMYQAPHSGEYVYYEPGEGSIAGYSSGGWETFLSEIPKWLNYMRREMDAPDLWSVGATPTMLRTDTKLATADNSSFSDQEKRRILQCVGEVREYINANHSLNRDQQRFVEDRLTHLIEASYRLGRKDWVVLALGALTNVVVGLALAPDISRELFRLMLSSIGWLPLAK
jgi:hypothetical protein